MRTTATIFSILVLLAVGASQPRNGRSQPTRQGTPDVQITADLPDTSVVELVQPSYPERIHLSGKVVVRIKIDESGSVVSARSLSGHPLLKSAALEAARKSRFKRNSNLH